ncbi:phospholipase DDHD2, partial [Thraustotheca clavata]
MAERSEIGAGERMNGEIPWAYLRKGEWTIFSKEDSVKLEAAAKSGEPVVVDDGRLLVSVVDRTLTAVYWDEPSCPVVRAEWLLESSSGKFIPLSEAEAIDINNLWTSLDPNEVHSFALHLHDHISGIETKKGETTIPAVQKLNEIFAKCSPTASHRCKAIHHGYPNWTDVKRTMKHLVFVVHGIGETYCKKRLASGTIIDQTLVLRQSTSTILDSHYPAGFENTIEFLPVDWSDVLGDMGDDLHARLNRIALDSMPFVRQISNELLSDILMYMARQDAVLAYVSKYMNVRYRLYRDNHPDFDGSISIMGHSLGSVISYDLLTVHCSELDFAPNTFFAFGSPIGLFLAL